MGTGDRTTVAIRGGVDAEGVDLPALPVSIDDVNLGDPTVMGAVEIDNVGSDGVWSLNLGVSLPHKEIRAVDVSERLVEGTYVLVRLEEESGEVYGTDGE